MEKRNGLFSIISLTLNQDTDPGEAKMPQPKFLGSHGYKLWSQLVVTQAVVIVEEAHKQTDTGDSGS